MMKKIHAADVNIILYRPDEFKGVPFVGDIRIFGDLLKV